MENSEELDKAADMEVLVRSDYRNCGWFLLETIREYSQESAKLDMKNNMPCGNISYYNRRDDRTNKKVYTKMVSSVTMH